MDPSMKEPALITTSLNVVSVIFPILSLISIIFRFQARRRTKSGLGAEDWCLLVSLVFTVALSVNSWIFGAITGLDYVKIDPMKGGMYSAMCATTSAMLGQIAVTTVKIAILLFYKRIFQTKKFKLAVWIAIFIISCWGIIFFLLDLLQGDPISEAWTAQGRVRIPTPPLVYSQVSTSIALDLLVLAFPLPMIFKLHLETRKKVGLILIFWLGAFCVVAAIVRLVLLIQVVSMIFASNAYMAIGYQSKAQIFAVIEPNCSVIAASLPCYGPLLKDKRPIESLLASFRSVFSVLSGGTGSQQDLVKNSRSITPTSDLESRNKTSFLSESQSRGMTQVFVRHENDSQHSSNDLSGPERIIVTRDVEVSKNQTGFGEPKVQYHSGWSLG